MTITELFAEARDLADTDSDNYGDTDLLRRVNSAIELLVSKIIQYVRTFPYDDENFGNIAIGTITLQEGISKYTITDRILDYLEVKVKDVSGKFHIVEPTTQRDQSGILETLEAETGLPLRYRGIGRNIFLSPAPVAASVTLSGGLQITYARTSYQITAADVTTGTLVPGIATPWHVTIARMAALPYCKSYKKDRVPQLERDIQNEIYGQDGILVYYANRQKDRPNRLAPVYENNK